MYMQVHVCIVCLWMPAGSNANMNENMFKYVCIFTRKYESIYNCIVQCDLYIGKKYWNHMCKLVYMNENVK